MTDAAADLQARELRDFEGLWQFDRQVRHATGDRIQVAGEAVFSPVAGGLLYREAGVVRMDGAPPISAVRTYLWRDGLQVCFEDGRHFHTVPPQGGVATHWCDPDGYEVLYDFAEWPCWTTVWAVRGPRKDYEMVTRFTADQARGTSTSRLRQ